MKITREMMLLATANVLANSPTKELLDVDPDLEDIFVRYAYLLHLETKDKEIDDHEFIEIATNIIPETPSDECNEMGNALGLALVAFASLIYKELVKMSHTDKLDSINTLKQFLKLLIKIDK